MSSSGLVSASMVYIEPHQPLVVQCGGYPIHYRTQPVQKDMPALSKMWIWMRSAWFLLHKMLLQFICHRKRWMMQIIWVILVFHVSLSGLVNHFQPMSYLWWLSQLPKERGPDSHPLHLNIFQLSVYCQPLRKTPKMTARFLSSTRLHPIPQLPEKPSGHVQIRSQQLGVAVEVQGLQRETHHGGFTPWFMKNRLINLGMCVLQQKKSPDWSSQKKDFMDDWMVQDLEASVQSEVGRCWMMLGDCRRCSPMPPHM